MIACLVCNRRDFPNHIGDESRAREAMNFFSPLTRDPDAPLPGTRPKDLLDLNQHDCRWPVRSDDAHSSPWAFCGQPASRNRYCAVHGAISYFDDRPNSQNRAKPRV
jgi:hypothetical protein